MNLKNRYILSYGASHNPLPPLSYEGPDWVGKNLNEDFFNMSVRIVFRPFIEILHAVYIVQVFVFVYGCVSAGTLS